MQLLTSSAEASFDTYCTQGRLLNPPEMLSSDTLVRSTGQPSRQVVEQPRSRERLARATKVSCPRQEEPKDRPVSATQTSEQRTDHRAVSPPGSGKHDTVPTRDEHPIQTPADSSNSGSCEVDSDQGSNWSLDLVKCRMSWLQIRESKAQNQQRKIDEGEYHFKRFCCRCKKWDAPFEGECPGRFCQHRYCTHCQ